MASKKISTNSKGKKNEIKENTSEMKENPDVEKITAEKENQESEEIRLLKEQLENMKKAFEELKNKPQAPVIMNKFEKDQEVIIGCRVLQGIGWGDPASELGEIRLQYEEEQPIAVSDMKKFFRQRSIKVLFEDGLCYFKNPDDYELFNIKKHTDLSDESLLKILNKKDPNEIIGGLAKLTDQKKNSGILNCVIFRICSMISKHQLEWDYYTRKAIEDYLGIEFDRGIFMLNAMQNLRK